MGVVKKRDEERESGVAIENKDDNLRDVDDEKRGWQTYLDWDEAEVTALVKHELKRTKNEMGMLEFEYGTQHRKLAKKTRQRLFDISPWGQPVPRPYIRGIPGPHRTHHSITWKLKNKLESLHAKKKWMHKKEKNQKYEKKLKHNEVQHIREYRQMKKK